MNFKTGDRVLITADDKSVPGVVTMASPNGISLIVTWDVMQYEVLMHGHTGIMPVLRGADGVYRTIFGGDYVVTIEPMPSGRFQ